MDFDVVVVGARCSGSPLAMRLAQMGHRVLVVDRGDFPSDSHSTHYLHQRGLLQLAQWGLLDRLKESGAPPIRRMEYRNEGLELNGWAEPVEGIDCIINPRRIVLDQILIDAATDCGVDFVSGFTVTELVRNSGGKVEGVVGEDRDRRRTTITSRMVVGADGAYSTVAKLVGARKYNVRPAAGFTYWNYYEGLDWEMAQHKTGFDQRWFGAWPTNDGHCVAVILSNDQLSKFATNPDENLLQVVEQIDLEKGQELRACGKPQGRIRRLRYPDNFYRESSGEGWVLIGDAGYHKDPITGWGMTDAFLQAEELAKAIDAGLTGRTPMRSSTDAYVAARDVGTQAMYDYTTTVAQMNLPPYFRSIIKACGYSQEWTNKLLGVIAGVVDGDQIFSGEALTRLYDEVGFPETERVYDPESM